MFLFSRGFQSKLKMSLIGSRSLINQVIYLCGTFGARNPHKVLGRTSHKIEKDYNFAFLNSLHCNHFSSLLMSILINLSKYNVLKYLLEPN